MSSQLSKDILGNISILQIWQLNDLLQECGDDVTFIAVGKLKQEYLEKYGDNDKVTVVTIEKDICQEKLSKAKNVIYESLSFLQIDLLHLTLLKRGYKKTFACIRQINKEHREKYKY